MPDNKQLGGVEPKKWNWRKALKEYKASRDMPTSEYQIPPSIFASINNPPIEGRGRPLGKNPDSDAQWDFYDNYNKHIEGKSREYKDSLADFDEYWSTDPTTGERVLQLPFESKVDVDAQNKQMLKNRITAGERARPLWKERLRYPFIKHRYKKIDNA